jgi:hypothetical protein
LNGCRILLETLGINNSRSLKCQVTCNALKSDLNPKFVSLNYNFAKNEILT